MMKPKQSSRRGGRSSKKPRTRRSRKVCYYCVNQIEPDYKEHEILGRMVTERGKILARRVTGACSKHQRRIATAVKQARHVGLLPFVAENIR